MKHVIIAAAAMLLGACAASPGPGMSARTATVPPAARIPASARQPTIMREAGLDAIIGKSAQAITARFGAARLDGTEGDARKLQFVSEACVLDIYLYPLARGQAPVATHVEARERQQGSPTDRSGCADEIALRAGR